MRKNQSEMREWRKVEREIGTMLTNSLLDRGFSQGDIARWGLEAWRVDGEKVQASIDELAKHFGDVMVVKWMIAIPRRQRGRRGDTEDISAWLESRPSGGNGQEVQ